MRLGGVLLWRFVTRPTCTTPLSENSFSVPLKPPQMSQEGLRAVPRYQRLPGANRAQGLKFGALQGEYLIVRSTLDRSAECGKRPTPDGLPSAPNPRHHLRARLPPREPYRRSP